MELPGSGRLAPASIICKAGRVSHWQPGGSLGEETVHTLTLALTLTLTPSSHPAQRVTNAGKGAGGARDCRDMWVSDFIQVTCLFPIP